jgi:subtilisin family serine protease
MAVGNNKIGSAGITWNTQAVILKVAMQGITFSSWELEGIEYLLEVVNNGKNIVALNVSLARKYIDAPEEVKSITSHEYPCWVAYKTLSETNKVVIVVGAGNDGIEVGKPHRYPRRDEDTYTYPQSYTDISNMIVVAAMDQTDSGSVWIKNPESPSGWGATNWSPTLVDLAAPGSNITSTWMGNKYMNDNGTSMAAPHVTGAVALLASVSQKFGISLKASDYKRIILESASKAIPKLTLDGKDLGPIAAHGTLDMEVAVKQFLKEYVPSYNFSPVTVTWTDGQAPAPTAGDSLTMQVTADRVFKNIIVTIKSPNGTETSLEPKVAGSNVEISFTPPISGAYTLDFTLCDAYDVNWNASLKFSATSNTPDTPDTPDKPDNPGESGGGSGGGGGCSAFGAEFLLFAGIVLLIRENR